MSQAAPPPNWQPQEMPFWAGIQRDIGELKRDVGELRREMKADLATMASTKADAAVTEQRWKDVWQDITELKTELRSYPRQQMQQQQYQQQQLYQQKILSTNQQMALTGLVSLIVAIIVTLLTHVRFQ